MSNQRQLTNAKSGKKSSVKLMTEDERRVLRYKAIRAESNRLQKSKTTIKEEASPYANEAVQAESVITQNTKNRMNNVGVRSERYLRRRLKKKKQEQREIRTRKSGNLKSESFKNAERTVNRKTERALQNDAKSAAQSNVKKTAQKTTQKTVQNAAKGMAKNAAVSAGGTAGAAASGPAAPAVAIAMAVKKVADKTKDTVKKAAQTALNSSDGKVSEAEKKSSLYVLGIFAAFGIIAVVTVLSMFSVISGFVSGAGEYILDTNPDENGIYNIQQGDYICPFPEEATYYLTSEYNQYRRFRYEGKWYDGIHYGIDIGAPLGTPLVASCSGTVSVPPYMADGYGNYVILDSGNGIVFYYGHLYSVAVNDGDVVTKGQFIGRVGKSGFATGYHLHFETQNLYAGNTRAERNIDPRVALQMEIPNFHQGTGGSSNVLP